MRSLVCAVLLLTLILLAAVGSAQQSATSAVPSLINYSGILYDSNAAPMASKTVGVTFLIYKQQEGGVPLWLETQNVSVDSSGRYTVSLGSTKADGMPVDLFSDQEERWLGVQAEGQEEQPRVLLVSVPYAFKAREAETLGGLPASAYLRATQSGGAGPGSPALASAAPRAAAAQLASAAPAPRANSGSANYLAMFIDSTDLVDSVIYQTGNQVVVGGTTPLGGLTLTGNVPGGDAAGMALYNQGGGGGASVSLDFYNTAANGGIPQAKVEALDDGAYSDHLTFWTKLPGAASNQVAERMRIASNGQVMVGGTTPLGALTLTGNVPGGDAAGMALYNQGGGGGASVSLDFYNTAANGGIPQAKVKALDDGAFSDHLTFWTKVPGAPTNAVTEKLRITSSGNVGIGTTAPSQKLEIAGGMAKFNSGIMFGDGTMQTTAGTGVTSFNGRSGAVVSAADDYNFSQLSGSLGSNQLSGTYGNAVALSNSANSFTGNGAGLTVLSAAALSGTLPSAQFSGTYSNAVTLNNTSNSFNGTFVGNGSGLTGVPSGQSWHIVKKSANYTIQTSDFANPTTVGDYIIATGPVSLTFTLPNPPPPNGDCVAIGSLIDAGINSGTNTFLTVSGNGLVIDPTPFLYPITSTTHPRRTSYFYCSDGATYYRLGYAQNGVSQIGPWLETLDTGAVNAYTTTFRNGMDFGLSAGSMIFLMVKNANTSTTPTLNVNGLGAKKITRYGNLPLAPGDLSPTAYALLIYDGNNNWELLNPQTAQVLVGTTPSIGGSALTAGSCATGTVTVQGSTVGHPVSVSASDGSLPNGLIILSAAVTSANTVTVQLCAVANNVTPAANTYNVATQ